VIIYIHWDRGAVTEWTITNRGCRF